jgi:hypothetical protein
MGEGLKRARAAARATRKPTAAQLRDAVIEECAKCIPTNWCDPLLTGTEAPKGPFDNRDLERLLRGIQDRIRACKSAEERG